jgi:molybdenum cofactor synthesis domain-containing protein
MLGSGLACSGLAFPDLGAIELLAALAVEHIHPVHGLHPPRDKLAHAMRCAILTVSTSTAAGDGEDISGPALVEAATATGAEVVAQDLLADDRTAIEAWLRGQVEAGVDLILTTGGTGLTPDDVTPEATIAVIEREVPGLGEAMRAASLQYTPMSMLSRALAGTAGRSLIINFPGSPKAITQLFPVVEPVLKHAVATLHRENGRRREKD